jgi:beta-N-acetylhexosaminidase
MTRLKNLPLIGLAVATSISAAHADKLDTGGLTNLVRTVTGGKSDQVTRKPTAKAKTNAPANFDLVNKSVTRKIGQMIMVGFQGTSPKHKGVRAVMRELSEGSIGGVMLMKHNIVSRAQVKRLTAALRGAARKGKQPPPLISVDQEGGRVQRLRFKRYPSAASVARSSTGNATMVYRNLACEVRSVGINVNFGPVADLDIRGRANPIIGRLQRSFGKSPQTVITYARQFVKAHKRYGVITAAKHFPGHGSSLSDSHKGFTAIPQWNRLGNELAPFIALANGPANQRVEMVMIGHLFNKSWGAPASLSNRAISGILRKQVNFRGIAITDDMEMGAIRKNYKWSDAIIRAVNAGNDILLYSNTVTRSPYLGRQIRDTIAKSVCTKSSSSKSRCIPPRVIEAAYRRISGIKYNQARMTAFKKAPRCAGGQSRKRNTRTTQVTTR